MSATQSRPGSAAGPASRTKTTTKKKRLSLTDNDAKVLGNYEKRKEAAVPTTQFTTKKFRTHNSTWTPMVHKPSNQLIFSERSELVSHWFDVWTDAQRKRFLDLILRHCKRSQFYFLQNWFQERVPMRHLDFTTVLPRFLTLYIFSFLDPRSMCRASEVCWRWKFLAEQDEIWAPKCMKLGWYLPYSPASNEYGAWKKHYVACLMTLDVQGPDTEAALYGRLGDGTEIKKGKKKNILLRSNKLPKDASDLVISSRPPWMDPDKKPKDLEMAAKSLLDGRNPNDVRLDKSQLTFHNKFGQVKPHLLSKSLPTSLGEHTEFRLQSSKRRSGHRILTGEEDHDLSMDQLKKITLSRSVELQNLEELRLQQIVGTSWEPPPKRIMPKRTNLSGGGDYPIPWSSKDKRSMAMNYPSHNNPRIVFISSRVPAADLLVDAVLFGVIPIVYEYEGTTLDSLMSRLDNILEGRHASTIGIFCHQDEPSEMRLVHGFTADLDDLDNPDVLEFFEFVANHTLPANQGGRIDLFVPLGANEYGTELMTQLQIVTGQQFNAPTGIIGNYNHINSEWLLNNADGGSPPALYFAQSKLNVWANTADIVQDAISVTKKNLSGYFEQKHRDLVSQVTGQMVFDAMGQTDIQGINEVTNVLVEGLVTLGKQKNVRPIEFLGKFLLEKSGMTVMEKMSSTQSGTQKTVSGIGSNPRKSIDQYSEDFDAENGLDGPVEEEIDEAIEEEIEEDIDGGSIGEEKEKKDLPKRYKEKQNEMKMSKSTGSATISGSFQYPGPTMSMTPRYTKRSGTTAKVPIRLSTEEFAIQPDKRAATAREIHATEVEFKRTLEILRDVYIQPLRAALSSNRAIISAASVQTIFSNPMQILDSCISLEKDLRARVNEWSPQQCLGDVFVKFCGRLKIYTNYCNNYTTILSSIERCMEQSPGFRAFLKRHNRTARTKMLTIQEILLYPTRRILEYTTLLSMLETHTPPDHADRADLAQAIAMLKDLAEFIAESKMRVEHEKEIVRLQKSILNCPCLLEANRYLIRHEDMALLRAPSNDVVPELRIYQHIEMLGLYLFNDALLITRRTTKHYPYERCMEHMYKMDMSLALRTIKVEDIADSKYVRNAFKMTTSKKSWICSADNVDAKYNWMTILESAIRAAVKLD